MGVVYEAEKGGGVAALAPPAWRLKVLPFAAFLDPRQLSGSRQRPRRRLRSTINIVSVYVVGCERGITTIMQYVRGTLAHVIGRGAAVGDDSTSRARPARGDNPPAADEVRADSSCRPPPVASQSTRWAMTRATPGGPSRADETASKPRVDVSTHRLVRSREFFQLVAQIGIQAANAARSTHTNGRRAPRHQAVESVARRGQPSGSCRKTSRRPGRTRPPN